MQVKRLREHKKEAVEKAIDALARYKFMMFGYWAAIWVHLNQIDYQKEKNPFREIVDKAREIQKMQFEEQEKQCKLRR